MKWKVRDRDVELSMVLVMFGFGLRMVDILYICAASSDGLKE